MIVPENLKRLRAEVDDEVRRFVFETMFDIEERLLAALPVMAKAVLESSKQASYSPTVTFRKGKGSTLKVGVAARVRLPDEEKQFVFRLRADGQLELAIETPDAPAPPVERMEGEQDLPMDVPAAKPAPTGPMTQAQKRIHEIKQSNIKLAREGRLTPDQMRTAGITEEDLAVQNELDAMANA